MTIQFFYSTDEDERNLFFGETQPAIPELKSNFPKGNYRVIDGQLVRIVSGLPKDEVREIIASR